MFVDGHGVYLWVRMSAVGPKGMGGHKNEQREDTNGRAGA